MGRRKGSGVILWGYARALEGNCERRGGRVEARFKRGCGGSPRGLRVGQGEG